MSKPLNPKGPRETNPGPGYYNVNSGFDDVKNRN
jgi:hypothetical protein